MIHAALLTFPKIKIVFPNRINVHQNLNLKVSYVFFVMDGVERESGEMSRIMTDIAGTSVRRTHIPLVSNNLI